MTYNQTLDPYSKNGCINYGIWNMFREKYGILVTNNFLLDVLRLMEKALIWLPSSGWVFSVIYKWVMNRINSKLWLNFKVVESDIKNLRDDVRWFWIKKFNKSWVQAFFDYTLENKEIEKLLTTTGIGHHVIWYKWIIEDSVTVKKINCTLDQMKMLVQKDLIWDKFRTFEPADKDTEKVMYYVSRLALSEKNKRLKEYIFMNAKYHKFKKSVEVYIYGRDNKKQILDWYDEAIWQTEE